MRRTDTFALNIFFLNISMYWPECICLYTNDLQMIQNKSVIRILSQYKKETQPHLSERNPTSFFWILSYFISFLGLAVYEIDL